MRGRDVSFFGCVAFLAMFFLLIEVSIEGRAVSIFAFPAFLVRNFLPKGLREREELRMCKSGNSGLCMPEGRCR